MSLYISQVDVCFIQVNITTSNVLDTPINLRIICCSCACVYTYIYIYTYIYVMIAMHRKVTFMVMYTYTPCHGCHGCSPKVTPPLAIAVEKPDEKVLGSRA